MQDGQIPVDPELRWISAVQEHVRKGTFDLISNELVIEQIKGNVELHVYFRLLYTPSTAEKVAVRSAIRNFARSATSVYVIHAVEFHEDCIRIIVYLKPQKNKKKR